VLEPVTDVETDRMCDMFLRRIGYAGLCEIELKRDVRDGRVKMIEANPRYTGSSDAALYTGVELDWLHYLDLIGERLQPVTPSLRDFRHIVLQRDFASFHGYRKEGTLKWRDVLRSYRPPVVFFDLDLRDWRNAADTLIVMTRSMVGPPLRQLLGKSAWPNLRS
jgi:D-aspartate ligase